MQARWIVESDLAAGSLVDLFPAHEATAATFAAPAMWLAHPSRACLPLKVRVFIDFLHDRFQGASRTSQKSGARRMLPTAASPSE